MWNEPQKTHDFRLHPRTCGYTVDTSLSLARLEGVLLLGDGVPPTQGTGFRWVWAALTLPGCCAAVPPPDGHPLVQVFSPSPDRLRARLASVRGRQGSSSAGAASQLSLGEEGG